QHLVDREGAGGRLAGGGERPDVRQLARIAQRLERDPCLRLRDAGARPGEDGAERRSAEELPAVPEFVQGRRSGFAAARGSQGRNRQARLVEVLEMAKRLFVIVVVIFVSAPAWAQP